MSFTGWIIAGIGAGAVLSIVFDDPVITGFGAAFGIMAGILLGRGSAEGHDDDKG